MSRRQEMSRSEQEAGVRRREQEGDAKENSVKE